MTTDTVPQTVLFPDLFDKPLFAQFNQKQASSDGGAILLKAAERIYLNAALDRTWEEWEIPREAGELWPASALDAWEAVRQAQTDAERTTALLIINAELDRAYSLEDLPDAPRDPWPADVTEVHRLWWEARIARQQEIDASIGARAEAEYLYDKPYEDRKKVRVAGPFTVESLSPHRLLAVNEHDELIDRVADRAPTYGTAEDFAAMVLGHLATTGVQQAHKADRITFSSVDPWPGERICAQGRYTEGEEGPERRAGILVGPEFGTVARQELVRGAREAAEAGFDVLVACAFNFEPHATEFKKLGALPVLQARMNADLHMADDLANTGKGNLFVIFGEPDIEILAAVGEDRETGRIQVKIHGVDVFHPSTGEVRSDGADGIACWFIDTDYNDESFFVRHAYFLGANDPYKALKTTLKAEIDKDAWETLHSDTSRPFERRGSGPHASPHFGASDHAENLPIHPLFHEHASERLHQRTNPILGPIGEMVVQHQPLPKQRMRPPLHRVRLQPAVITDALARRTQQTSSAGNTAGSTDDRLATPHLGDSTTRPRPRQPSPTSGRRRTKAAGSR